MRSPDEMIDSTKYRAKLPDNTAIAKRLGLSRQTLARKRKHPSTFTGGEITSLAKLLAWTDQELTEFTRGCKG